MAPSSSAAVKNDWSYTPLSICFYDLLRDKFTLLDPNIVILSFILFMRDEYKLSSLSIYI